MKLRIKRRRGTIQAGQGIRVTTTAANTIISATGTGGGGGGGYTEGGAVDAVGSDGKLNKVVKHSTWATPSAYPTVQKVSNASGEVLLDSNGVKITNSSGFYCYIAFTSLNRNLTVTTISYCVGGVQKSMDIIGSAPY